MDCTTQRYSSRHFAAGEASDMAVQAREALTRDLNPAELVVELFATTTPDLTFPSTAAIVQPN